MLSQEYLSLRLVRLKPCEEWTNRERGLCFVQIKGGAGEHAAGSHVTRVAAGDVLFWNGDGRNKLCAAENGEMAFWFFSICVEHLFPLFVSDEISLLQNVSEGLKTARCYHSSSGPARECQRLLSEIPPQFSLDHRTQLLRVLGVILTVEFKAAQPQRVGFIRVEEHMMQVFEKLSSNELLTLSVGDLAARFSCSRRHLNRLFHQHFGMSVAALRMEMRLLKAVSLLRDPNIKVINVAEQCGFNHLGLFNTCFKRRFGETPGQWRKSAAESERQRSGFDYSPAALLKDDRNADTQAGVNGAEPSSETRKFLSINGPDGTESQQMWLRVHFKRPPRNGLQRQPAARTNP